MTKMGKLFDNTTVFKVDWGGMGRRKKEWKGEFPRTCGLIYDAISKRVSNKVQELGIPAWQALSDPAEDKFHIGDARPRGDVAPAPMIRQSMDERYKKASGLASRIIRGERDERTNPYLLTRRSTELIAENLFGGDVDELVWGGDEWVRDNAHDLLEAMVDDALEAEGSSGLPELMAGALRDAKLGYAGYARVDRILAHCDPGKTDGVTTWMNLQLPDLSGDDVAAQDALARMRADKIVLIEFADSLFQFLSGRTTMDLPRTIREFCTSVLIPAYDRVNDSDRLGLVVGTVLEEAFTRLPGEIDDLVGCYDGHPDLTEAEVPWRDVNALVVDAGVEFADAIERAQASMYALDVLL